jgi:hypothetical protein
VLTTAASHGDQKVQLIIDVRLWCGNPFTENILLYCSLVLVLEEKLIKYKALSNINLFAVFVGTKIALSAITCYCRLVQVWLD